MQLEGIHCWLMLQTKTWFVNFLCLRLARLAGRGVMLSICSFVHLLPNLCTRYFENEPIFMPFGTNGSLVKGMKLSTLGTGDQTSRSQEAEDRFGSLAGASCSTLWSRSQDAKDRFGSLAGASCSTLWSRSQEAKDRFGSLAGASCSTLWSRSQEAKDRFGSLAGASCSTLWVELVF